VELLKVDNLLVEVDNFDFLEEVVEATIDCLLDALHHVQGP